MLQHRPVESKSVCNLSTLKDVLEQLDITAFSAEFVTAHKQEKVEQITCRLRPESAREITKKGFSGWERAELRRMCTNNLPEDRRGIRFWHRLRKKSLFLLPGDEPVIRFWETSRGLRFYTCLRWVRVPLKEARGVPEFVKAKAREVADLLPDASFTVEQLRSEQKMYDPFLIASYGDESYYIEVWEEPEFERKHT